MCNAMTLRVTLVLHPAPLARAPVCVQVMCKMGAIMAAGIIDAGGRNVTVGLRSRSGFWLLQAHQRAGPRGVHTVLVRVWGVEGGPSSC